MRQPPSSSACWLDGWRRPSSSWHTGPVGTHRLWPAPELSWPTVVGSPEPFESADSYGAERSARGERSRSGSRRHFIGGSHDQRVRCASRRIRPPALRTTFATPPSANSNFTFPHSSLKDD